MTMRPNEQANGEQRAINEWDFIDAVKSGDVETVRQALAQTPRWSRLPWNARNMTPLHLAAKNGKAECVKALLPTSDANAATTYGEIALICAAESGSRECVRALLAVSDAKAVNQAGWSALMFAAESGAIECVRALAPHSDLTAMADSGKTALEMALNEEHWDCVDILASCQSLEKAMEALDWAPKKEKMPLCRALAEAEEIRAAIGADSASSMGSKTGEPENGYSAKPANAPGLRRI